MGRGNRLTGRRKKRKRRSSSSCKDSPPKKKQKRFRNDRKRGGIGEKLLLNIVVNILEKEEDWITVESIQQSLTSKPQRKSDEDEEDLLLSLLCGLWNEGRIMGRISNQSSSCRFEFQIFSNQSHVDSDDNEEEEEESEEESEEPSDSEEEVFLADEILDVLVESGSWVTSKQVQSTLDERGVVGKFDVARCLKVLLDKLDPPVERRNFIQLSYLLGSAKKKRNPRFEYRIRKSRVEEVKKIQEKMRRKMEKRKKRQQKRRKKKKAPVKKKKKKKKKILEGYVRTLKLRSRPKKKTFDDAFVWYEEDDEKTKKKSDESTGLLDVPVLVEAPVAISSLNLLPVVEEEEVEAKKEEKEDVGELVDVDVEVEEQEEEDDDDDDDEEEEEEEEDEEEGEDGDNEYESFFLY